MFPWENDGKCFHGRNNVYIIQLAKLMWVMELLKHNQTPFPKHIWRRNTIDIYRSNIYIYIFSLSLWEVTPPSGLCQALPASLWPADGLQEVQAFTKLEDQVEIFLAATMTVETMPNMNTPWSDSWPMTLYLLHFISLRSSAKEHMMSDPMVWISSSAKAFPCMFWSQGGWSEAFPSQRIVPWNRSTIEPFEGTVMYCIYPGSLDNAA